LCTLFVLSNFSIPPTEAKPLDVQSEVYAIGRCRILSANPTDGRHTKLRKEERVQDSELNTVIKADLDLGLDEQLPQ
jgi:hypothetical protein